MWLAELKSRLENSNQLYVDLVAALPAGGLSKKLSSLRSNTIGAQIWCVVGARESYLTAAKAGSWQGFSCPLDSKSTADATAVTQSLESTYSALRDYLSGTDGLGEAAVKYLMSLLQHESQHHGQLIRYIYSLEMATPGSWKQKYSLE